MTRITEAEYQTILRRQAKPQKPATTMPCVTEAQEQEAVVQWAQMSVTRLPGVELLFHIANENAHHKMRQGVCSGVPDLCLPVARGGYYGLWIELKRADHSNGPSPAQKAWLERLQVEGYFCVLAYGASEAIEAIENYLRMP